MLQLNTSAVLFIMFLGSSVLDPEMAHQMFSSGRKLQFLCQRIVNLLATLASPLGDLSRSRKRAVNGRVLSQYL